MFFRKAKRIKELEAENKTLQTEIMLLKSREFLGYRETLNVETYQGIYSLPDFIKQEKMEEIAKVNLACELCPLMRIEFSNSPEDGKVNVRASIRVVKER